MLVQIKAFFEFIGDKHLTLPGKAIFIISLLIIFIFVDWMTNFTHNYEMNQKLAQLEQVSKLKEIYKHDSTYLVELLFLEEEIVSRSHYLNILKVNQDDILRIDKKATNIDPYTIKAKILADSCIMVENMMDSIIIVNERAAKQPTTVSRKESKSSGDIRNIFWMVLSSSFLFVFIAAIGPISVINEGLSSALSLFLFGTMLTTLFTFLSYGIPIIDTSRLYFNYIINIVIHFLCNGLLIFWLMKYAQRVQNKVKSN